MDALLIPKIEKWRRWFDIIHDDIVRLASSRQIYRETVKIYRANRRLHGDYTFINWVSLNYVRALAIGIRRQAELDKDVISLARLLDDIARNGFLVKRSWYVAEVLRNRDRTDLEFVERTAQRDFNWFAPTGSSQVSSKLVQRDLDRLQHVAGKVIKFVNRRVAHWDKRRFNDMVTYGDVHKALRTLDRLLVKYHLLIRQAGLFGATPFIQGNWKSVFRIPWVITSGNRSRPS